MGLGIPSNTLTWIRYQVPIHKQCGYGFHERIIDLSYMCIIENVELYIDPEMMTDVVYVQYMPFLFFCAYLYVLYLFKYPCNHTIDYGCILILHLLFLC